MQFMDASSRYVIPIKLLDALGASPTDRKAYRNVEVWRAARQLDGKHDKPFFLAVGIYKPHDPQYAPVRQRLVRWLGRQN